MREALSNHSRVVVLRRQKTGNIVAWRKTIGEQIKAGDAIVAVRGRIAVSACGGGGGRADPPRYTCRWTRTRRRWTTRRSPRRATWPRLSSRTGQTTCSWARRSASSWRTRRTWRALWATVLQRLLQQSPRRRLLRHRWLPRRRPHHRCLPPRVLQNQGPLCQILQQQHRRPVRRFPSRRRWAAGLTSRSTGSGATCTRASWGRGACSRRGVLARVRARATRS